MLASFSERFRMLRESRGWTQDDAAERLGVSRSTIAGYESESKGRIPREETLVKIAELFEVTTDYLLGRTDDPKATTVDPDPIPPEEREFLQWVKEHVTGTFFYDWHKAQDKDAWLRGLRIIYEMEKGRKPGQKQGE